jgi:hypothetical protein
MSQSRLRFETHGAGNGRNEDERGSPPHDYSGNDNNITPPPRGGKVEGVHHNHDKKKDRPHVAKGPLSR